MRLVKLFPALLALSLMAVAAEVQKATDLPSLPAIPLGNVQGAIGPLEMSTAKGLLFVGARDNNSVEIVDVKRGVVVHSITGVTKPGGLLYLAGMHRLYVATATGVEAFDDANWSPAGSISTGAPAGTLRYDAAAKRIYAGVSGSLVVIDPATNKTAGTVKLNGDPDAFELETSGPRIFVNLPAQSQIAVVDRKKMQVTSNIDVTWAKNNVSMALDEKNKRLLVGARTPGKLLVLDTESLQWITEVILSDAMGDVFFDAPSQRVFVLCGSARVPGFAGVVVALDQLGPDHYKITSQTITGKDARSGSFVPSAKRLFVGVAATKDHAAEVHAFDLK